ncbi:hypothetical protein BSKO_01321 [Bryopsis sp. KO-2023]|nr:hypothetical protein BSKO_01321 [Bryopsis sp. KO-2023]
MPNSFLRCRVKISTKSARKQVFFSFRLTVDESMAADGSDLSSELEALHAIYDQDILVWQDDADLTNIAVRPSLRFHELQLQLCVPKGYPGVPLRVSLTGVPDGLLASISQFLNSKAQSLAGEPSMFNIASAASEWMESNGKNMQEEASQDHESSSNGVQQGVREDPAGEKAEPSMQGFPKEEGSPKHSMRTALDVINRIRWDSNLDIRDFTVAYLDRFVGVIEGPFNSFDWEDLMFPQHRVQYFKYKNEVIWDKRGPLFDNVFGSRGKGLKIMDIVERYGDAVEEAPIGNEVESPESDTEGSEPDGERTVERRYKNDPTRPNYFVCTRIDDPEVLSRIEGVQRSIVDTNPGLASGVHPPNLLHVTWCMLRLRTPEEIEKAKSIMKSIVPELVSIFSSPQLAVEFEKLGDFRDRLIYVKGRENAAFTWFSQHLMKRFQDAGIPTPGNHPEFTLHASILRLSRPMARKLNVTFLDRGIYLPFQNTCFGSQTVKGISLCPTGRENIQPDGFYERVCEVKNEFLDVHPGVPELLADRASEMAEEGLMSLEEADALGKRIENGNSDVENIEEAFERRNVCGGEDWEAGSGLVLIIRGLSGSGKSSLLRDLQVHFDIMVCSADSYFDGESYQCDLGKLADAHRHCLDQFVSALERRHPFIAVDNTNSRLWEYGLFVRLAKMMGFRVKVVEMACTNISMLKDFAARNVHGISLAVINKMFDRWEVDPEAVIVQPFLDHGESRSDPSEEVAGMCMELMKPTVPQAQVLYTALFLTGKSRADLLRLSPPMHKNVKVDHVTIAFRPTTTHAFSLPLGSTVKIRVTGIASDELIQAATVDLLTKHSLDSQRVPHITISAADGVPSKLSNDLIARNNGSEVRPCTGIDLEGVVACVVSFGESRLVPLERVVDKGRLRSLLHSDSDSNGNEDEPPILATEAPDQVEEIFVFDFDDTVFDTPLYTEAIRDYEQHTGQPWPHRGFWGQKDSLLPPLKSYPGPAFQDFITHCGRRGALTVLMTGRIETTREGVESVLASYGVKPDRLILKTGGKTTSVYKVEEVRNLLYEFRSVKRIKLWDDLCENLAGFSTLSKRWEHIEWDIIDSLAIFPPHFEGPRRPTRKRKEGVGDELGLSTYMSTLGCFPDDCWKRNTKAGIDIVTRCWAKAIGFTGAIRRLASVFGSYPIGRKSDVDMCLLAPHTFTHKSCMSALEAELRLEGVRRIYQGHSSRCPRLKVQFDFIGSLPVECDIVFCCVSIDVLKNGVETPKGLLKCVEGKDEPSKVAVEGPIFMESLQKVTKNSARMKQLAVVVEALSRILAKNHMKGNAFHCPRTFHLVKLAARCLAKNRNEELESSEQFLVAVLEECAEMKAADWSKLFKEFVPQEYVPPLQRIMKHALGKVKDPEFPKWKAMTELFKEYGCVSTSGYSSIEVKCTCECEEDSWMLLQYLTARAGTCVRNILAGGFMVLPGEVTIEKESVVMSFMVEEKSSEPVAVQKALLMLKEEVEAFEFCKCSCLVDQELATA